MSSTAESIMYVNVSYDIVWFPCYVYDVSDPWTNLHPAQIKHVHPVVISSNDAKHGIVESYVIFAFSDYGRCLLFCGVNVCLLTLAW